MSKVRRTKERRAPSRMVAVVEPQPPRHKRSHLAAAKIHDVYGPGAVRALAIERVAHQPPFV